MTEFYVAVVSATENSTVIIDKLPLTAVWPWAKTLDGADQQKMLEEQSGYPGRSAEEVREDLRAWKTSAKQLRDPKAREVLLSEDFRPEDFVEAPRPRELTYAEKVSAPLTEAEIEALNSALASGNYARIRRPSLFARDLRADAEMASVTQEDLDRADAAAASDHDVTENIPKSVREYVMSQLDSVIDKDLLVQAIVDDDPVELARVAREYCGPEFRAGLSEAMRVAVVEYLDTLEESDAEMAELAKEMDAAIADGTAGVTVAPPLSADVIAEKYNMSVADAQAMIDGGAVDGGSILFVDEEARKEFLEFMERDRDTTLAQKYQQLAGAWPTKEEVEATLASVRRTLKAERDDARALALALEEVLSEVCDEWYVDNPKFSTGKLPDWFSKEDNGRALWNNGEN